MSKLRFIAYSVWASVFFVVCILGVMIVSTQKTPEFEELKTEEYTFVKEKYYPLWLGAILDVESRYEIYVLERDDPFLISGIVFGKIDGEALDSLEPGDTISVTFEDRANRPYVYSLKCGEDTVFSYEEYAEADNKNRIGLEIFFSVAAVFHAAVVAGVTVKYVRQPNGEDAN